MKLHRVLIVEHKTGEIRAISHEGDIKKTITKVDRIVKKFDPERSFITFEAELINEDPHDYEEITLTFIDIKKLKEHIRSL